MAYEDSVRLIIVDSLRIRRNEAVKAGLEVVFVEVGEIDILIGGNSPLMVNKMTTEQLGFVPPVNVNDVTESFPVNALEERTRPCLSQP